MWIRQDLNYRRSHFTAVLQLRRGEPRRPEVPVGLKRPPLYCILPEWSLQTWGQMNTIVMMWTSHRKATQLLLTKHQCVQVETHNSRKSTVCVLCALSLDINSCSVTRWNINRISSLIKSCKDPTWLHEINSLCSDVHFSLISIRVKSLRRNRTSHLLIS